MELLNRTLNGLKKRLEKANTIYIQHTEGMVYEVTCDFKASASEKALKLFENQTGYTLPQDYKDFLKLHNGSSLLYTPDYGDGIELFSIEYTLELYESWKEHSAFERNLFAIGTCKDGYLLIDADLCKPKPNRDGNYIHWLIDGGSEEDVIPLHTNFELWLDRIIAAQGDDYWNWSIFSAENYYKYK
ncbi:SMI1/KNR4 family protein [Bacillus sp. AFS029533]|uniref:SMI1/KNR4 family protein n=1 Tax=Bacillus sp. AFS029533 TaxID=2033494 RepID=UPI000403F79E|nr:SMI1/KNR4 family protein [Bacillus sp. AFS029533]PGZ93353.1 hypothetical protein COE53_06540 [Bacillus sp. AFS029533]